MDQQFPEVDDPLPPGMETAACPFRCDGGDEPVIVARDRLHDMPGRFRVVCCRTCGLMRTTPRPDAREIMRYYPADYQPYRVAEGGGVSTLRRIAQSVIDFRTETLPEMPPGRMLEIGCASGNFLHKMQGRGWRVAGVEASAGAAAQARARGFDVATSRIEDLPERCAGYDLVVGWMVVEHLHEPLAALTELAARAAPGGRLAISVPNASAWGRKAFGENWFALQTPTHLTHFTPASIRRMLQEAGWQVERVMCQRIISDIPASLGNLLADRFPGSERLQKLRWRLRETGLVFNLAAYPAALVLAALGQTDRMTIHARRKG